MQKTFYILWTYEGNYSELKEVKAETPQEAVEKLTSFFSKHFHENASIYCFDRLPVLQRVVIKK